MYPKTVFLKWGLRVERILLGKISPPPPPGFSSFYDQFYNILKKFDPKPDGTPSKNYLRIHTIQSEIRFGVCAKVLYIVT
jgi:hypothetical protein